MTGGPAALEGDMIHESPADPSDSPAEAPVSAEDYERLGDLKFSQESSAEALTCYRKALELTEREPDFDETTAGPLSRKIGYTLLALEKYRKAIGYFEYALKQDRQRHGDSHPAVADGHRGFGKANAAITFYVPASNAFKKAIEIDRATLEPDSLQLVEDLVSLADVHGTNGTDSALRHFDEAYEGYLEAIDILKRRALPDEQGMLPEYLARAAKTRLHHSKPKEAVPLFEEMIRLKGEEADPTDPTVKYARNMIATCRMRIPGTPERAVYSSFWLGLIGLLLLCWTVPQFAGAAYPPNEAAYWLWSLLLGCLPSLIAFGRTAAARDKTETKGFATVTLCIGALGGAIGLALTFSVLT